MDVDETFAAAIASRYHIERKLGEGGMAVVYLARDMKHGRQVALKVLRPELATTLGAERFLREITIAARLVHPNILPLHDSGEAAGHLYYVMPYVEGATLRERLDREKQLPLADVADITSQIAAALDYAHSHGVVHRDVKPDNVLLVDGRVLVADFGLARALTSAASTPLTRTGTVVGTPAYMSPEQCAPGETVDARSDVYALACMAFEMIAGVTPFRGATAAAMMAHQISGDPPSVCAERQRCPAAVDEVLKRGLAKSPADRYQRAGELAEALREAVRGRVLSASGFGQGVRLSKRVTWVSIAAGTIALISLSGWLGSRVKAESSGDVALDTTRIALLPLERDNLAAGPADELLYEAFARWQDIELVDPFQVADAIRQRQGVRTDDDARAVSRSLGAGRYVRGRLQRAGDSLSLRVALYQVGRSQPLEIASLHLPGEGLNAVASYREAADSLLLRGSSVALVLSDSRRHSLAAMRAFARGQHALDEFDLPRAETELAAASSADPEYSRAYLWLAQVRAWQRLSASSWRDVAARALVDSAGLSPRDQQLAQALVLLGDGEYARACRVYDALSRHNDQDFAAEYGLGQCRTLDKVVVPDDGSPTGWRFRSSYRAGLAAYERALSLLPTAHQGFRGDAFESLRELLLTSRDQLSYGYSIGPDSGRFLARLAWMHDTLALVPYPWAQITGGAAVYPPGFERALNNQRAMFRRLAGIWSSALPQAAAAKEALAISLELLGDPAAADTLQVARRLAAERARRIQLGAAEVLVRVKFGVLDPTIDLAGVRVLMDSLLADSAEDAATARALIPLAELRGRCARAVQLARQTATARARPIVIPRQYAADAAELLERSSLGCQRRDRVPSVATVFARLQRDVNFESSESRRIAEEILLVAPAQLSFPNDSAAVGLIGRAHAEGLVGAMRAAQSGNIALARAALERIDRLHGGRAAWIEASYPEARLWIALGDSIRALHVLHASLSEVISYDPRSLAEPARAAALLHALALQADLHRARGDVAHARRPAAVVVELWTGADEPLTQVVQRMKADERQ